MAIEQGIPEVFNLPPGSPFYIGDPGSEYSGEELQTHADLVFVRLPLPPTSTPSQGLFVQGKFKELKDEKLKDLSDEHPDAQWAGWQVFVRPPRR